MIAEHERIVLTDDLLEEGLEVGDVGTVVFVHGKGAAYEVEFLTLGGATAAVGTVHAEQARPVGQTDLVHARPLSSRASVFEHFVPAPMGRVTRRKPFQG